MGVVTETKHRKLFTHKIICYQNVNNGGVVAKWYGDIIVQCNGRVLLPVSRNNWAEQMANRV